jgi:hypothetical protein
VSWELVACVVPTCVDCQPVAWLEVSLAPVVFTAAESFQSSARKEPLSFDNGGKSLRRVASAFLT